MKRNLKTLFKLLLKLLLIYLNGFNTLNYFFFKQLILFYLKFKKKKVLLARNDIKKKL